MLRVLEDLALAVLERFLKQLDFKCCFVELGGKVGRL
jgi:hypothetical protein